MLSDMESNTFTFYSGVKMSAIITKPTDWQVCLCSFVGIILLLCLVSPRTISEAAPLEHMPAEIDDINMDTHAGPSLPITHTNKTHICPDNGSGWQGGGERCQTKRHVVKSRGPQRRTLRGWMTDRTGHMERETSVGGEKQGQIKSERGRWRKAPRASE